MEAAGLLSGAEAVGYALPVAVVWGCVIWLGVWLVGKLRRKLKSKKPGKA